MWKVIARSVAGSRHRQENAACQDAHGWLASENQLILVAADGAGSASHAEAGAALACQRLCDLASTPTDALKDEATVRQWFASVRESLAALAVEKEVPLRQLATTLLLAVVDAQQAIFAQIGDGAIVVESGDGYRTLFWPEPGEYANETRFITEENWQSGLGIQIESELPSAIAVFTDGLQRLALNFATRSAHSGFFRSMFAKLRTEDTPEELHGPLGEFLDSPAVLARTDDDKTLLLAVR